MAGRRITAWLLAALLLPALALGADKKKAAPKPMPMAVLPKVAWLSGPWRQEKGGRLTEEYWLAPAGGAMLGVTRTVAKGRELDHAFLQIREGPGGDLYYVWQATGQKEALAYRLLSLADTEAVFENKDHPFPQTITYTRQTDGTLLVVSEGFAPDGKAKRSETLYQPATNPNP